MEPAVLYVRGERDDREVEHRLHEAGFGVEDAATTERARQQITEREFDCVVSRFEVPRPNGLEFGGGLAVLEAVRDVDEAVPFVLFTRIVNRDVVREAIGHHVYDYIRQTDEQSYERLIEQVEAATANYRAHRRVRQLSRINELIRDVNSQLVRAATREEIVQTVTAELTRLDAYGFAWIGERDWRDPFAAAGPEAGTETGTALVEPVVAALGEDRTIHVRVDGEEWPLAREAGYASAVATRIGYEEEYATLVLFSERADAFDETEREVIEELADTIGYALDATEARRELKRRERELEQKNDRLENFASMVSHDLRNPLQTARGHLELIDGEGHAEAAGRALDRMATIIDNILTLAREEDLTVEATTVDLDALARSIWAGVRTYDATLATDGLAPVAADRTYLRQILENLFRNAVEHGGQDVRVTLERREDGFAVCDDGPGIAPEDRDRIFEMGVTGNQAGTGFGLAIVREMAAAHGWTVRTEESGAGGACFVFEGVTFAE